MTKYYIIETNYVGPNQEQHVDADKIEISTSPALTNMSREARTEGRCGTTNDWAVYAHGEYTTIEEARDALTKEFGEVRSTDANGDSFESDDGNVVETYKMGKYAPMSSQVAEAWAYGILSIVDWETTDADIAVLLAEFEADANHLEGCTLDSGLRDIMRARRDELRDEMDDDYYR